jgi:hypothetical protein
MSMLQPHTFLLTFTPPRLPLLVNQHEILMNTLSFLTKSTIFFVPNNSSSLFDVNVIDPYHFTLMVQTIMHLNVIDPYLFVYVKMFDLNDSTHIFAINALLSLEIGVINEALRSR